MNHQLIRTFRLILALTLLAVSPLRPQIVHDGATNTLSNVTNPITDDVTVGTKGSFTLLTLSDNALLTNSANGLIGRNATATSKEIQPGNDERQTFANPFRQMNR